MSISIIVPNADFSANPVGIMLPVQNGLEFFGLFGGSSERTARNYVPKKPKGSVFGSLNYQSNYVRCPGGGLGFIDTNSPQFDSEDIFVIARSVNDANTAGIFSNRGGTRAVTPAVTSNGNTLAFTQGGAGDNLVNLTATSFGYAEPAGAPVSGAATVSNRPNAAFRLFEFEHVQGAGTRTFNVRDHTVPTTTTTTVANTVDRVSPEFGYRIGASHNAPYNTGTLTQPVDVAMFVHFSRSLSAEERLLIVARLKQIAATYSLTV